jgi:malate dehydrogenase
LSQRVAIIGAGEIGITLAYLLSVLGCDVIVYNRYHNIDNKPSPAWLSKLGRIYDIGDAANSLRDGSTILTHDIDRLNGYDIFVVTSGTKRNGTEETRESLAAKNIAIIRGYADLVVNNIDKLWLVISNPVDIVTRYLLEIVGDIAGLSYEFVSKKILGVSYVDTMRFRNIIKELLVLRHGENFTSSKVDGYVIGEHGPSMVPLISTATVSGTPITDILPNDVEYIVNATIDRGNSIIKMTGKSSVFGPASAAFAMINMFCAENKFIMPCAVWHESRVIGRVCHFKDSMFDGLVDHDMSMIEKNMLRRSETILDAQYKHIQSMLD